MSRLSKEDQAKLIRSGEQMQRTRWTQPIGGVPVDFEVQRPMPPDAIGDINSDAKGSGARYNAGKPPFELIPLAMLGDFFAFMEGRCCDFDKDAIGALQALGCFQARTDAEAHDALLTVLDRLGSKGWDECARVFEYGRAKYAAWNWAKGMAWSIPIACAARHLLAMLRGEEIDPESGLPHRGHVFCNIVMLYTFGSTYPEGDDRPAKGLL